MARVPVVLPKIGMTMEEATVVRFCERVCVIETDGSPSR